MAAHPVTHPSANALRAFALGELNDSSSAELMDHLDSCPDCCKQIAALSGDDFLNRLHQARGRSFTPAPAKALADGSRAPKQSADRPAVPNLPPELAANQQYEILRELGRGGMGVVYLAKNKLMDRLEVLKVVNKALLDHPGAVERFLREIRSAAKLSHANVVAAYSVVQQGELLAFAMEYVEGQDLASLVKSQGPLPIVNACYYVQQAALGLQHALEKGMVHRDIKPQNLILAREGKKHIVKILDFGLAKATREKKDDTGLTGEGKMLGTPDYIAPEQTMDAAKADIRADIYSLGCTLYYLLSGHPPFSAGSLTAVLVAHQMHEAKPLNLVRPEVPEELAAVVRKMMVKSPAKRYQTPLEVVQALNPFIKQSTTPKPAPELSSGTPETGPAITKAVPVDSPPAPVAELPKKQPEPADVWESLAEGRRASSGSRRSGRFSDLTIASLLARSIPFVGARNSRKARKPGAATVKERAAQKKWLISSGLGVGVLLLALLGMWASGVFKVKTPEGIIVLENLPADAEVLVDGERLTVRWSDGDKNAEIRVRAGTHKVEVKNTDGFLVEGKELTLKDGDREIVTVRLLPEKPQEHKRQQAKGDAPALEKSPAPDAKAEFRKIEIGELRPSAAAPADKPGGPRADYDVLATGRWVALLPAQEVFERLRSQKSYIREEPRFEHGILETKGGGRLIIPMDATNLIVRARVRKLPSKGAGGRGNVGLSLRLGTGKPHYDAWFNGGGVFGISKWDSSHSPPMKILATCQLSEAYEGFFEFAFAAVGDALAIYANGRRVLEAHGPEILKHGGNIMIGGEGLFQDFEVQILDPAAKSAPAADTGFVPLFNGKDLTGWEALPGYWHVEDGAVVGRCPPGRPTHTFLISKKTYRDFDLKFQVRRKDGFGNSGVQFRSRIKDRGRYTVVGPQCEIDSANYEFPPGSLLTEPNLNPLQEKARSAVAAKYQDAGFNDYRIRCVGKHVTIEVNGIQAIDGDFSSLPDEGVIAWQIHGGKTPREITFRNIEIKELPADPSAVRASDSLPTEAKVAAKAYEKACADARAKLLSSFEKALDHLANRKGVSEIKLRLINAVEEEKARFENRRLVPWSAPMQPALARYLEALVAAHKRLALSYNSLIDKQIRAKNERMVDKLRADLRLVEDIHVLAMWKQRIPGKEWINALYSNGRVGAIDGKATWSSDKGVLQFRWADPRGPGGIVVDTLRISADGLRYEGTNQDKKIKILGEYVK